MSVATIPSTAPALLPAAVKAASVSPTEILAAWFGALSSETRRSYATSFRAFVQWATGEVLDDAAETAIRILTAKDRKHARGLVIGFRAACLERGLSTGTTARRLAALTSSIRAFHDAGAIPWTIERVAPKVEAREDRSGPRRNDVERIVEAVESDDSPAGVRDAAIVRLLHDCGLRRAEVTGLRVGDVRLGGDDGSHVLALRKGCRERKPVLVGHRTSQALRRWIELRGDDDATMPLFVGVGRGARGTDKALSGESVRKIVARRAERAGVKGAVRPHGLRHSGASHVARRGSLTDLMAYGQWSSMSSARRYLDRIDDERRHALAMVEA